jgi:hypothetical protein
MRGTKRPLGVVTAWVRRQPPKVKAFLAVVTGMAALVFIRFIVHDHDNLFVAAEAAHALGIAVLIYKLTKEKTCAGSCLRPLSPLLFAFGSVRGGPSGLRFLLRFCAIQQRFSGRSMYAFFPPEKLWFVCYGQISSLGHQIGFYLPIYSCLR